VGDSTILSFERLQGSMKPARVDNAMVNGVAIGPEGERIAIEVKSPRDDIVRGIGQCYEAATALCKRL